MVTDKYIKKLVILYVNGTRDIFLNLTSDEIKFNKLNIVIYKNNRDYVIQDNNVLKYVYVYD